METEAHFAVLQPTNAQLANEFSSNACAGRAVLIANHELAIKVLALTNEADNLIRQSETESIVIRWTIVARSHAAWQIAIAAIQKLREVERAVGGDLAKQIGPPYRLLD